MIKVLYVDDEPVLLEIAKIFLEKSQEFSIDVTTSVHDIITLGEIKILRCYHLRLPDGGNGRHYVP